MKDFQKLINKILKKKVFIILISVLTLLFIVLLGLEFYFLEKIDKYYLLPSPIQKITFSKYPVFKTTYDPDISARGAIILDADSKVVLYEKNSNFRFSTASTAKIMTALTALSHFDLNNVLTVKTATDEGALIGLDVGEKLSFESLLYALLLPSGNDAALTIAQNYKGGQEKFVLEMNNNAKRWYLLNTHFVDPAGLIDEGNFTTPFELSHLASIALKNSTFAKTVSTKDKSFTSVDGRYSYSVSNLNELLGINGVNGVKTGYTRGAGQVLVSSKLEPVNSINGEQHQLIIVVMDSKDRFEDTRKLLNLVSGNINFLSIHP